MVRMVFAMAKTKSGDLYVECMTPEDVEDVRSCSKAKDNGPWVDWWDQMAIKTAFRRLSKRVPMSTDLDDLIRRDDELYDFDAARKEARARGAQNTIAGRLEKLAAIPGGEAMDHKPGSSTSDSAASRGSGEGAAASGSGSEGMQDQGSGAAGAAAAKTRAPRKPRGGAGGAQQQGGESQGEQQGDPGAGAAAGDHDPQTGEVNQGQGQEQSQPDPALTKATSIGPQGKLDTWAEYFTGWKSRFVAITSAEEGDAVKATYSSMAEKSKRNALIKTDKDADERDTLLEILGAKLAEFKKA